MNFSSRSIVMLVVLAGVSVVLAALVSLLPAEWQDGPLPSPVPFSGRAGIDGRQRPVPLTPGTTPLPQTTPVEPGAGGRFLRGPDDPFAPGFGALGIRRDSLGGFTVRLASLLTLPIAGMLLLYLMPQRLGRIAASVRGGRRRWLRLGLLGLAVALLVGAFGVLAVITLAGAPFWLAVGALGYFGALLGLVGLSLPLGRWIGYRFGLAPQAPPVDLLAGLLGIFILTVLPVIGGFILLVLGLLGLGVVVQTRAGSPHPWTFDLPDIEY